MNTESKIPGMKRAPNIPRWAALTLAPLVWLVVIPLGHGIVPWAVSLLGRRYGWHEGGPAYGNLLGLVPVVAGTVVLLWLMVLGFAQAAKIPKRVELDWRPKISLERGPYAFSRHPMYLAELALWLGWTILYGSLTVLAGFTILCIIVHRFGPKEERDLEARFGNQYREYKSRVPRWLRIRSRTVE